MDRVKAPFDWNDLFMHLDDELCDPDASYILAPRPPVISTRACAPDIILLDALRSAPYRVKRSRIVLSSHRIDAIARSVGLDAATYLRTFGLVAYTKWRAVALNPRLHDVDLFHSALVGCLFECPDSFDEYLYRVNRPFICGACENLYRVMGAELDLAELRGCLREVSRAD